jgi:hypothetical protein
VDGWVRWALVAAAVVLPYSAVLIANSGRDQSARDTSPVTPQQAPALTELPVVASPEGPNGQDGAPSDAATPDAAAPGGGAPDGGRPTPGGPTPGGPGAGRVIDHVDD